MPFQSPCQRGVDSNLTTQQSQPKKLLDLNLISRWQFTKCCYNDTSRMNKQNQRGRLQPKKLMFLSENISQISLFSSAKYNSTNEFLPLTLMLCGLLVSNKRTSKQIVIMSWTPNFEQSQFHQDLPYKKNLLIV